jgi:nicotinamidase-related amidase
MDKKNRKMDKKIRVLILIDMQNDFISGSLANQEAQAAIPAILEKIKNFDGDVIYLTMDTHQKNYLDTPEGKKLPVEHCIYGTDGWRVTSQVEDAVVAKAKEGVQVKFIPKPTFGSIESVHFDNRIKLVGKWKKYFKPEYSLVENILYNLEINDKHEIGKIPMEIEMCGFCTDICVVSNALILKAFTYDFAEITVDSKCCAGVTPEKHEAALEVMRSCQINII